MIPLNLTEVFRTLDLAINDWRWVVKPMKCRKRKKNENDDSRVNNGNSATGRTGSFHTDELYLCIG